MQQGIDVLSASDRAATVLHPVRMQLLQRFREPSTAAEVARALELPRQRVGHHVRRLQEEELLLRVGERRKGNFVEQVLQTSARAYVIAPEALGPLSADPATIRDRFSTAYLLATAGRTIHDLGELQRLAREQDKRVATLTLEGEVRFSSPEQQQAFAAELTELFRDLLARYHDDAASDGRSFRFTVGGYPALPEEREADA